MDMISGQIGALAPIVQFSGNWAVAIKLFLEATELSRSVLQQAEVRVFRNLLTVQYLKPLLIERDRTKDLGGRAGGTRDRVSDVGEGQTRHSMQME